MFLVLILEFSFIFKYQNNAKNILDDLLSAYKNIYFKYRQTYVHTCCIYYMLYVYSRNVNECVLTYIFRKYFFTQKFVSCEQLSFKWDTQKTNARSFSRPHIITIWMKFDSKNFGTLNNYPFGLRSIKTYSQIFYSQLRCRRSMRTLFFLSSALSNKFQSSLYWKRQSREYHIQIRWHEQLLFCSIC